MRIVNSYTIASLKEMSRDIDQQPTGVARSLPVERLMTQAEVTMTTSDSERHW